MYALLFVLIVFCLIATVVWCSDAQRRREDDAYMRRCGAKSIRDEEDEYTKQQLRWKEK